MQREEGVMWKESVPKGFVRQSARVGRYGVRAVEPRAAEAGGGERRASDDIGMEAWDGIPGAMPRASLGQEGKVDGHG